MIDYKVTVFFKGYVEQEVSHHYDCDNSDEAIDEALDNIDQVWLERIDGITCEEIDE